MIVVQSLEGDRPIWPIHKRYTNFVELHQKLTPLMTMLIASN